MDTETKHAATQRHPSTEAVLRWLEPNPNLPDPQREIAQAVELLAEQVLHAVPEDSAELTTGLRKLLEAKDCFVRASLTA